MYPLELIYDETKLAVQEKQSEIGMREEIGDQDARGRKQGEATGTEDALRKRFH